MSLQLNLAVFALVLAGVATAAETPHVHGTAEIELAVEGSDIAVNFASPLYNLVGFEHAPRDEGDREAVAEVRALLDDPANLVRLQADAACTVVELDVHWDVPPAGQEEPAHDETAEHDVPDDRDSDEHEADDADDAHHDADDDHDAPDTGEQHADVTLAIRYRCDHADRLTALEVTAFESFERLSEVELRAVGPGGAVAETASRGSPQVNLRNLLAR